MLPSSLKKTITLSGHNAVSQKGDAKLLVKKASVLHNSFTVHNRQNLEKNGR